MKVTEPAGRLGLRHFKVFAALVLAAVICAYAPAPPLASAAVTHKLESFSPLEGPDSGVVLHQLSAVAIDEATGNVFASDGEGTTEGEGIIIFGAEGGVPTGLAAPFVVSGTSFFQGNTPAFLAYDNSGGPGAGTLYAYDNEGTIRKYVRNGATERYEEEAGGEILAAGCGVGSGGGIDDEGNVYFGCQALQKIYEYAPTGALLHEYDLAETPVGSPGQVAVDAAGDLFIQQQAGGLYKFPANALGAIEPSNYEEVTPTATGVAYEPVSDTILVPEGNGASEYSATSLDLLGRFGDEVFTGRTERIAVNLASQRIYVADYGHGDIAVFGPPAVVPTTVTSSASNVTATKATLNGSVNAEGLPVTACEFEYGIDTSYGQTVPCDGSLPSGSSPQAVTADVSGLVPGGTTYHFRLVTENANGHERGSDKEFKTAALAETLSVTGVGASAATLNGALRPEGEKVTSCKFEYGLASSGALDQESACTPAASSIESDFAIHQVSASLSNLEGNTTYRFRLAVERGGELINGEELEFTTMGPPQVTQIQAFNADQTSATLEAKVNPRGFPTRYRIEWGPTTAYGNTLPTKGFEPLLGSGEAPIPVTGELSGLSPGTAYHYRVVATNNQGQETDSPDQIVETLNACGLPEQRCFELVSRKDAGPIANPGKQQANQQINFQAATSGPGALAYVVESGYPDATRGAEVLYLGTRGGDGWNSAQLDPPLVEQNETKGTNSNSSSMLRLADDLSCGVVSSQQALVDAASTRRVVEAGGSNLYRRNPDGSYTTITSLPPTNAGVANGETKNEYQVLGMSKGCKKVVFLTNYTYPGVSGTGAARLYEWEEGDLRNLGVIPAEGGAEVAAVAEPGSGENQTNLVSEDGSRVFFSARRLAATNEEEVGQPGIFVREAGAVSRDLSVSETGTADVGAVYQYATPDGSRVYFTANYGLTSDASSGPTTDDCSSSDINELTNIHCDLYEYNLSSHQLVDLSVDHDPEGAEVVGFMGASRSGAHVYFVAQGQLVRGRGPTRAQNEVDNTFSIYSEVANKVAYVGRLSAEELTTYGGPTTAVQKEWTSRVSPDGRYLLFETSANVTGYESGGPLAKEAYLYDSAADVTTCLSCRRDGKPSLASLPGQSAPFHPLAEGGNANQSYAPQSLTEHSGRPQVFFASRDRLAPGGTEGTASLYEWSHGQIFFVAPAPEGILPSGQENESSARKSIRFLGASADGTDTYFATATSLNWEDGDSRSSVYDARVGGGFAQPAGPAVPCSPMSEGSCQGQPTQGAVIPGPSTSGYQGPGNSKHKKKHHKKKHHKKKHHKKKHHKSGGKHKTRHADQGRRAGK